MQKRITLLMMALFGLMLALQAQSPAYRSAMRRGQEQYEAGNYAAAKKLFNEALRSPEADTAEANRWVNNCDTKLKEKADAEKEAKAEAERREQERIAAQEKAEAERRERERIAAQEKAEAERREQERIAAQEKNRPLTFTVNGVSFKMLPVEGGTFTMGATSEQGSDAPGHEKPMHSVTLSSFYMGETEVTQALWQAVMGSNPSEFKGNNLPVETVSWDDCQTFINKLNQLLAGQLNGKRFALPTEAQWEYAARGGKKSKGYKYSGSNTLDNVAWYASNSGSATHAVGKKQANELGLYDMSGNVWEWCSDWYGSYGSGAQTNPTGSATGSFRVLRGGGWGGGYGGWGGDACGCRVSCRIAFLPTIRFFGLRLAL